MRPFSLSVISLLLACGPKDGTDTDPTGSTGSTTDSPSTSDPPTTGGPPPTTGDMPTTGDVSTTGGPPPTSDTGETPTTGDTLCETPGAPIGPPVEVRIRNGGATRAFVDLEFSCFSASPFELLGPDQSELKLDLGAFEFTCDEAAEVRCGEDAGCPIVGMVTQIEPGATFVTAWSGGSFARAEVSEACAEQFCGGCWLEQQAPPGKYAFRLTSGTMLHRCDQECVPCEADDSGVCTTQGVRANITAIETVMLDYPAQTSIEIVIP